MSKIFTRSFRVRYSETNADGIVGPAEYLRYLVETAYDWGEAGGFGAQDSQALGIAWVIRETEYSFFQPLQYNDEFDFTIWMLDWKRVRGYRAYELYRKGNPHTLIAQGTQQLVSLDSQTLRPTTPPESIMAYYRLEKPRAFEHSFAQTLASRFPDLPDPQHQRYIFTRRVDWRDIDSLGHVNNAVYFTYAEQAALQSLAEAGWSPERLHQNNLVILPKQVFLKYHQPAIWGDVLESSTSTLSLHAAGGLQRILIRRSADGRLILECFYSWESVQPENHQPASLPDELHEALQKELSART